MLVSIVIPCKSTQEDIEGLRKEIAAQRSSFDTEVVVISNISPPGKARNAGARNSRGDILVFLDCDVRLGNEYFLAKLIQPLLDDTTIGLAGASVRIPPGAGGFQRRYAREIPHCQTPVVDSVTDIQVATSACCAIYRDLFFNIGGFNERIVRGEDSVLSQEVMNKGLRVVLAPTVFCYHPQPANLIQLINAHMRNGRGACFVDTFYPDLNLDVHPEGITYFSDKKTLGERCLRFATGTVHSFFTGRILLLLSKAFYGVGYLQGLIDYKRIQKLQHAASQER